MTALEVPCLIHLGHWRVLVEPVGLEPTLGFFPLIKSQVSASNSSTTPKLVGHREVESRPGGRKTRVKSIAEPQQLSCRDQQGTAPPEGLKDGTSTLGLP